MRDKERTVAALILTGAPGAGKTSALVGLAAQLDIERRAYGAIETEQLAQGSPLLRNEEWIPQLADRAPAIEGIDLVLDTDSLDRDEVVAEILAALAAAEMYAPPAVD
jgi:cytidylate kinase